MGPSLLSFLGGVAFATGAFGLAGMQSGGPGTAISGDVREFLSHVEMVDIPIDDYGNTARTVRISGINVQIVDGSGSTLHPSADHGDAKGNLIIGYNEQSGTTDRTGNHNLVVGLGNEYSSFAGVVFGYDNEITGTVCTITGGGGNFTNADASSISGGFGNRAIGAYSSVSGGLQRGPAGHLDWIAGSLFEDQ